MWRKEFESRHPKNECLAWNDCSNRYQPIYNHPNSSGYDLDTIAEIYNAFYNGYCSGRSVAAHV